MCLNPTIIRNNRLDYKSWLHPHTIAVPCNDCEECTRIRRSDYQTRAIFESKRFKEGSAIMVLLTYDDEHVPYLHYKGHSTMAFSRQHISDLLYMLRAIYDYDITDPSFTYLIGAEYGVDPTKTERPHYHALFFLSPELDAHEFMSNIRKIWDYASLTSVRHSRMRKTFEWHHGRLGLVLPFENDTRHSYMVDNLEHASIYCAKYAVKQVHFYNKPLLNIIAKDKKDGTITKGELRRILRYMPKVWTSRGFGLGMLHDPTLDIVKCEVNNPYTGERLRLPKVALERLEYQRIYTGRTSPIFDDNNDFTGKYRKLYDRIRNDGFIDIRKKRIHLYIDKLTTRLNALGCLDAHKVAIYHYVYAHHPVSGTLMYLRPLLDGDLNQLFEPRIYDKAIELQLFYAQYITCDYETKFTDLRYDYINGTIVNTHLVAEKYIQDIATFDTFFEELREQHDEYYPQIETQNHEKQGALEALFANKQKLRELLA